MKNYNEIKESILSIDYTIRPIRTTSHNFRHSDGLTQTHRHDVHNEYVNSLKRAIWGGGLSLKEKIELNNMLASKMLI